MTVVAELRRYGARIRADGDVAQVTLDGCTAGTLAALLTDTALKFERELADVPQEAVTVEVWWKT